MENSTVIMLAWVVNLMCKSSTSNSIGLLYKDNLIKCESVFYLKEILKNKMSLYKFSIYKKSL